MVRTKRVDKRPFSLVAGGTHTNVVEWSNGPWTISVYSPYVVSTYDGDRALDSIYMMFYHRGKLIPLDNGGILDTCDMLNEWDEAWVRKYVPKYVYRAAQVIVRRIMARIDYWDVVRAELDAGRSTDALTHHWVVERDSREPSSPLWYSLYGRPQYWTRHYHPMF